jgi:hypothetical protein
MCCRHILASGLRCGSPALKHENFCYYHHATRRPVQDLPSRRQHQAAFILPNLEDRASIQLALGHILDRIASHAIDPKRAGLLLYGLQIALSTLPKPQPVKAVDPPRTPEPVDELIHDETYGILAPPAEYQCEPHEKSLEEILIERWKQDGEDELERRRQTEASPAVLDQLQAKAEPAKPRKSPRNPNRLKTLRKKRGRGSKPVSRSVSKVMSRSVPHSSQPHRDEWVNLSKSVPHSSRPHREEWGNLTHPTLPRNSRQKHPAQTPNTCIC